MWAGFWLAVCFFSHSGFWLVVHEMYSNLQTANKLTKTATVAIPYAKKGKVSVAIRKM